MAVHSPLSARLAEEAGFDGLWASGFELSALFGLPDVSLVSMSEHLDMTRRICAVSSLPVIADIDTGFGNAVNVLHTIAEYERAGAAAVVIEDKTFPKVTSLVDGGRQELVRVEEFQGKVEAAVAARVDHDFLIVARTEALIAGAGEEEALRRAEAYVNAGADLILIHSKQSNPDEIVSFTRSWDVAAPLAVVPTTYSEFTPGLAETLGKIGLYIYGNHAIRASVSCMQKTFARIIADNHMMSAQQSIASLDELFRLQGMAQVKTNEARFLR